LASDRPPASNSSPAPSDPAFKHKRSQPGRCLGSLFANDATPSVPLSNDEDIDLSPRLHHLTRNDDNRIILHDQSLVKRNYYYEFRPQEEAFQETPESILELLEAILILGFRAS